MVVEYEWLKTKCQNNNYIYARLHLRFIRRVRGDDGTIIELLLFVIAPNSVEIEEETDVDRTDSVVNGVGSAIEMKR